MKILHTSDWHLGHLLYQQKRDEEQRAFLDWLLQTITAEQVELLLVAGDVFDTGLPSNYALELYYSFLARCMGTSCRHIVIVGGNHDSPANLHAPRDVLRALQVSVVGAIDSDAPAGDLVEVRDVQGNVQVIVVAVPFLRDREVHLALPGEAVEVRAAGIIEGTAAHFTRMAELASARRAELGVPTVPLIATGHLFALGAARGGAERDIYVGDLSAFPVALFPEEFAYIALGHLHRPQTVAGRPHVRYSGSPIPLSFDEALNDKQVIILDSADPAGARPILVPTFRRLVRVEGDLATIAKGMQAVSAVDPVTWVDVAYTGQELLPDLSEQVERLAETCAGEVIVVRDLATRLAAGDLPAGIDIRTITPQQVFEHLLDERGVTIEDRALIESAWREVLAGVGQGGAA